MKKVLYLGSDPSHFSPKEREVVHCPLIRIVPRGGDCPKIQAVFADLLEYTHILFTSKHAVAICLELIEKLGGNLEALFTKELMAIGTITAKALEKRGFFVSKVAKEESQEGIVEMLRPMDLDDAYLLLPCSALSRQILSHFLMERGIRHQLCATYDTVTEVPDILPDLTHFEEIIFTSPSTVNAFFQIFQEIPEGKKLGVLGPITEHALKNYITKKYEVFYV